MDSPEHEGQQTWYGLGPSGWVPGLMHVLGESAAPNLDRAAYYKALIDAERLWDRYNKLLEAARKKKEEEEKKADENKDNVK